VRQRAVNRDLTDLTDWRLREEVRGSREDSPPSDTLPIGHSRDLTLSPSPPRTLSSGTHS
jgi:hypothetical protein